MPSIPCPRGSATRVVVESAIPFLLNISASRSFVTATAAGEVTVTPSDDGVIRVKIEERAPASERIRATVAVPDDIVVEIPAGLADLDWDTRQKIGRNIIEQRYRDYMHLAILGV